MDGGRKEASLNVYHCMLSWLSYWHTARFLLVLLQQIWSALSPARALDISKVEVFHPCGLP